jgi:hypothetical protein
MIALVKGQATEKGMEGMRCYEVPSKIHVEI